MWGTRKREYKLGTEVAEDKVGSFTKDGRQSRNRFKDRNNRFGFDNIKFVSFVRSVNECQFAVGQTS